MVESLPKKDQKAILHYIDIVRKAQALYSLMKENGMSTFTAVVHKEENFYVAECPEAGTVSQGKTIEEAIQNLQEATGLYLEEFPLKQACRPLLTTFEVPVHA